MSKTIKQLAEEIGVSKTAIRKKMTDEVKTKFSETIGNTVYISKEGESIIKSSFLKKKEKLVSGKDSETVTELVSILKHELASKNKQLEVKDIQIIELQNLLNQQQQLQLMEQKKINLLLDEAKKEVDKQTSKKNESKGFFTRLFNK
jgi:uncharacterized Zn finger protein